MKPITNPPSNVMEAREPPTFNLFITNLEKEGPFLKVWGQTERNASIYIEQFLLNASPQFELGTGKVPFETLQAGTLVCAKYKDNKYYRARIVSIDYFNGCFVEVNFIDNGNRDIVPSDNIRSLQNFPTSFISIPPAASAFILAEAHCPGGGDWKDHIFDALLKDLRYQEVNCQVVASAAQFYLVKIYANLTDVKYLYSNRGLLQSISLQAQQAVLLNMSMEKRPTIAVPPTAEINTYKSCTLDPMQQYAVYVSFVNEGPALFSVQLQQSEQILAKLMKEINEINLTMMEDVPLPGTICLARCQEDGHVCRAVVTNEVDNQFKVFYVDFGNYETLPLESLFQIPFKYVLPKVMAIRVALNGVEKSSVTLEMLLAFKKFVDNRLLYMKVLSTPKKTIIPKCELWDPETKTSALDVINRAAQHAYPEPLILNRGFSQPIKVSYVFSCNRFYVQLCNKEPELSKLMEELQVSSQSSDPIYDIKIGLPCLALFEGDQLWYRSQIVDIIDNDCVKVRYIDYGNEEVVSLAHLRSVEGELLTVLRPQAIECCLNGYQNMGVDETRDAFLEELIFEKQFIMKVSEMSDKKALVELIDSNNYNVASLLLDKIAASKSQVSPVLVQAGNTLQHRKSSDSSDNYRPQRKPAKDWNTNERNQNKNFDKRNDKSWRSEGRDVRQNDANSNDRSSDSGSWRQTNKGNNPNEFRDKDRSNRNQDKVTKEYGSSQSYYNQEDAVDERTASTSGQHNSNGRKIRDDRKRFDNWEDQADRGEFHKPNFNKDGHKRDFKKDGSEMSSSGSEKSFKKAQRTNTKNDRAGGRYMHKAANNSSTLKPIEAPASGVDFKPLDVVGSEAAVVISWFHNPGHFYCQLQSVQPEFKVFMKEIHEFYKNRKPESCEVGTPVIAMFPEDNVLYRARILERKNNEFKVFYVDFGNVSSTNKVWPIDKTFMELPAQAVACSIPNLSPVGDNWPDLSCFNDYFGKDFYMARFLDRQDNRTNIQLWDGQSEVGQLLVEANLARLKRTASQIEIPLLLNQQLRVVLQRVNSLSDIIVELSGLKVACKAHNLEAASQLYEDVLKAYLKETLIIYVDKVLADNILEVTFYDLEGNKIAILTPDEGALDVVEPICPHVVFCYNVSGSVVFVKDSSIFVQTNDDEVSTLLDKLYNAYENLGNEGGSLIPEEGFLYAVHSSDGNWYRGRVESFDDDKVTVYYIDYGNSECVAFGQLRELKSEFYDPHELCLQVNVPPGIAASLLEANIEVSIYYGENGWEGQAIVVKSHGGQFEQVASNNETSNILPEQQLDVEPIALTEQQVSDEAEKLEQPENVAEEEHATPEPIPQKGTPIFVSHIDSPSEFYVQFPESIKAIDELQETLQALISDLAVLDNISVGVLCAAPYSVDQNWYRAEVLDADEDITTVRFVDFGNTDVIDNKSTQLKTLPPNLLSLAVYATRCSLMLKAIDDEWNQQVIELFLELAQQGNLTAEFLIQDEKTNIIELYSNGRNVKDALLSQNLAVPCEIVTECKTTCFVSHLNSPSEFWVQMENCIDELEWIAEQLSNAEQFPELEDLSPGTLCAALFPDDEMWYRARILSNTTAGIELLFIDYGNSCVSTSLRQLPEQLLVTSPLAQKCCLQRPENIPYWTREAQDKFSELSADGQTIFQIKKISTGETAAVELILNNENIVSRILPVTAACTVRNFDRLNKFNIEKAGEVFENVCLEPLPGMEWTDESDKKFLELYPSGTILEVEFISEDCVRLYRETADIRPQLGGIKTVLNRSITVESTTEQVDEVAEPESEVKAATLHSTSGKVGTAAAASDVTNENGTPEAPVNSDPVCDISARAGETDNKPLEPCAAGTVATDEPSSDEQQAAVIGGVVAQETLKVQVEALTEVPVDGKSTEQCAETVRTGEAPQQQAVLIGDVAEGTLKVQDGGGETEVPIETPQSSSEDPEQVPNNGGEQKQPPKTDQTSDDTLLPGSISEPQPLPANRENEIIPTSNKELSSRSRRISHDDRILPAVVSRFRLDDDLEG